MKEQFLLQHHKLHWHLDRVLSWQRGESIAPIHIDVGLGKGCNIHCHYCFGALQRNQYKSGMNVYFQREALLRYVREAGECGVRSMAFIGESEPLLNPHVYEAISVATDSGVDVGLGTNGILLDTGRAGEEALERLTFIRFNVSAATKESYQKLHGSPDFEVMLNKVRFVVATKRKKNLDLTVGFQMVLTPQDADQIIPLTLLAKEMGVDYLQIKQCADTQNNSLNIYNNLTKYAEYAEVLRQAEAFSTDSFTVFVKWHYIQGDGARNFGECLGAPFLLYSSGDGKLYSCGMFFDYREEELCLGDLNAHGFKETRFQVQSATPSTWVLASSKKTS